MTDYIDRNSEELQSIESYKEILDRENHHDHKIIKDEHGTHRWEVNKSIKYLIENNLLDLKKLCESFSENNLNKNSEEYRQFYRDLGYSLSGYWEVFYWEVNNEDANKYRQKEIIEKFFEDYDTNRKCCPNCGSDGLYDMTLLHYIFNPDKIHEYKNNNICTCSRCGNKHLFHDRVKSFSQEEAKQMILDNIQLPSNNLNERVFKR